jgi:hypothetical protein
MDPVERRYREHLSERDLALIAGALPGDWDPVEASGRFQAVLAALARDEAFDRVFGRNRDEVIAVSPFLAFTAIVHRAERELQAMTHVPEWVGPRRRLPVFGAPELRDFLAEPASKLFLAELLTSYVHISSGSVVVRSARGWRRHRFSELDPVRLASLLEVVQEVERPGLYRRLGDLALFLTGVFPDRSATRSFREIDSTRLLMAAGIERAEASRQEEPLNFLEGLGRRWYQLAYTTTVRNRTFELETVGAIARHFSSARRALNFVTDRYLFPLRGRWFGTTPGGP